jgi:hypothetical protein
VSAADVYPGDVSQREYASPSPQAGESTGDGSDRRSSSGRRHHTLPLSIIARQSADRSGSSGAVAWKRGVARGLSLGRSWSGEVVNVIGRRPVVAYDVEPEWRTREHETIWHMSADGPPDASRLGWGGRNRWSQLRLGR